MHTTLFPKDRGGGFGEKRSESREEDRFEVLDRVGRRLAHEMGKDPVRRAKSGDHPTQEQGVDRSRDDGLEDDGSAVLCHDK